MEEGGEVPRDKKQYWSCYRTQEHHERVDWHEAHQWNLEDIQEAILQFQVQGFPLKIRSSSCRNPLPSRAREVTRRGRGNRRYIGRWSQARNNVELRRSRCGVGSRGSHRRRCLVPGPRCNSSTLLQERGCSRKHLIQRWSCRGRRAPHSASSPRFSQTVGHQRRGRRAQGVGCILREPLGVAQPCMALTTATLFDTSM